MHGVTGTGKTYLIKKIAEKAHASLLSIDLSTINGNKLIKEIKNGIDSLSKPLLIYFVMHHPELISNDVITAISKLLDGEFSDIDLHRVIIAGSSVRPTLPLELRRSGRFDKELLIGLPNESERLEIIKSLTKDTKSKIF